MELMLLANRPEAIPQVAKWYRDEWGYITDDDSRSTLTLETKLEDYLNLNTLPLILLATNKDNSGDTQVIAAAQLRFQEMSTYPESSHWLGGVYVDRNYRGNAVAQKLISGILQLAKQHGVKELYLQTEDHTGGLYKRMGWKNIERVNYHNVDVLVMKLTLTE